MKNPDNQLEQNLNRKSKGSSAFTVVIILVLLLAAASYLTTAGFGDGAFPSGEYLLFVQDLRGNPIQGAHLNIYQGRSYRYAFEYPFDNYLSENSLISDENGEIVIVHIPRGFEFGGFGFYLFWIFPVPNNEPVFFCRVSTPGYKTMSFSAQRIFDIAYETEDPQQITVKYQGEVVDLSVYKTTIYLTKK